MCGEQSIYQKIPVSVRKNQKEMAFYYSASLFCLGEGMSQILTKVLTETNIFLGLPAGFQEDVKIAILA